MPFRTRVLLSTVFSFLVTLCFSSPHIADIAVFQSGGTLHILSHQYDQETILLRLEGGGEVRLPLGRLKAILPDERVDLPEWVNDHYQERIETLSRQFQVDPLLVSAVVKVESGYRPNAKSTAGAIGLMQLLPETASRYTVSDLYDPSENLRGGILHLKSLLTFFEGDQKLALAAYNAGKQAVLDHGGIPPYKETNDYLRKISLLYPLNGSP